ncbi:MAG TPA: class I SAM-dependent methyltransferase [Gaiellaceae bacterium]
MEPTDKNMRAWNEIHRRRAEAMKGQLGLPTVVRSALGDLTGRRVLHLQCATGESSAELAELGALVTGVDISSEALEVARERWPDIAWVQADVHDLPSELKRGRFDLVYTADGVLVWLHDLDPWASGIAASLRSGGDLLLHEEHPVVQCVDESLRWREDYFDEELHAYRGWTHFELTGPPATEEKIERLWRLGQVVTAIAGAGLVVRQLEEYPATSSWRRLPSKVPGKFTLLAQKP